MDYGDKSWMDLPRTSNEYSQGVKKFLDRAFEQASQADGILCPFKECANCHWKDRNVVENHLIVTGFTHGYIKWVFHGERISSRNNPCPSNDDRASQIHDDIDGLLHDTFQNVEGNLGHEEEVREGPSEDAKIFLKLVEEGNQELYPGCKSFSKLGFTIRLYLLKCIHGWSDVAFSDLLALLKEAFQDAKLPGSFYKAKSILAALGLSRQAFSTCVAVQPIHRPSTSSNNEGQLSPGGAGENESGDEDLT